MRLTGRPGAWPRARWRRQVACLAALAAFPACWLAVGPARPAAAATTPARPARAAATSHARAPRAAAPKTVVSLTFDDADADQMAAAQILHRYHLRGTFFIITSAIGSPTYMTTGDLRTLAADGDEIGDHTVNHLSMPKVSLAEARRQICDGRDILTGWGFHVTDFAYPDATYNRAVERVVRQCGLNSARIGNGIANGQCPGCAAAETIPPRDPYAVRTPGQIDTTWTVKAMENVVTNAEASGGGWIPFVFHHICTDPNAATCGNLSISPAHLTQFVRWLAKHRSHGARVETVAQVVGGHVHPQPPAPAARPHGVENGSLAKFGTSASVSTATESTSGVKGPSCWMYGGYGQNTAQWSRIPGGHDGGFAERAVMTSHTSGDAKLLQQFDMGQCSLPVTPGQAYQLSSWYTSTVRTQYAVYYRDPSGRWVYWTSSPYFPATNRWAKAAWQTPAVPPGASGLSFGLSLASAGSLTTSDYGFQKAPIKAGVLAFRIVLLLGACAVVARIVYTRRAPIGRAVTSGSRRVKRHIAGAWEASGRSSSNP